MSVHLFSNKWAWFIQSLHIQRSVRRLIEFLMICMPPPVDFSHMQSVQTFYFSSQRQKAGLITIYRQNKSSSLFQMQRCFAAESQVHVNKNSYLSSLTGRMSVPSYLFCMWISTGMKVTVGCWDRLLLFCPKAGGIAVLVVLGSNSRFTLMRL